MRTKTRKNPHWDEERGAWPITLLTARRIKDIFRRLSNVQQLARVGSTSATFPDKSTTAAFCMRPKKEVTPVGIASRPGSSVHPRQCLTKTDKSNRWLALASNGGELRRQITHYSIRCFQDLSECNITSKPAALREKPQHAPLPQSREPRVSVQSRLAAPVGRTSS